MTTTLLGRLLWRSGGAGDADPIKSRALMARTSAWLFLVGAALMALVLVLPHNREASIPGLLAICVGCLVGTAVALVGFDRLPLPVFDLLTVCASVLATGARWFGENHGASGTGVQALYLWIGLYAFYFFGRRRALLHIAWIGVLYGAVLVSEVSGGQVASGSAVMVWTVAMTGLLVAGLFIALLRERLVALIEQLVDAVRTDPLTGLLNRRGFTERLEEEFERARRSGRPFGLVVGDLDRFKQVNDLLGHQAGDRALMRLGRLLEEGKRTVDAAARLGGEEFALLVPDSEEQGAHALAERLRREVRRASAAHDAPVTISFGIATYPAHARDPERLMQAADAALYSAKRLGRDCSVVYSPGLAELLLGQGEQERGPHQLATLLAITPEVDRRAVGDPEHSRRVATYAGLAARELGFRSDGLVRIRLAGILHDIGAIGVSRAVLHSSEPLTGEDWLEIRRHPELGARMLDGPALQDLCEWVLDHHERPDGTGYPRGLAGDQIPLEARIIAVADAYEAMTSGRPHRPPIGEAAAWDELSRGAGTQFDLGVVAAFRSALERDRGERAAGAVG
jgi:diguanylate cyclase (GGDEF)-like protein